MIKYIPYNQDLGAKDALRIVPYFVLPQFYPIFAYREADAPLLCYCSPSCPFILANTIS